MTAAMCNDAAMNTPTAEDRDFYDSLYDSIESDVPDTVWESDALSKGAGQ